MKRILSILISWARFAFLFLGVGQTYAQELEVLWDRSGAGSNSWYGGKVVPLNDQNDDGYSDFAVWVLGGGLPGSLDEEKIEFFHGATTVPSTPYLVLSVDPDTADNVAYFEDVGDFNGDGYEDCVVWWELPSRPDSATVNLYFGGPFFDLEADYVLCIPITTTDVGPIGDFNGDGYDDLYRYHLPPLDYGEMLYGGSTPDTVADWVRHSPQGNRYQAWPVSHGDVNGDGYSDFVACTPSPENLTCIFLGGTSPDTVPAYVWEDFYSATSVILEDVNGDSKDDLVFSTVGGHMNVHLGREVLSEVPDYILNFDPECNILEVSGLGDINDDGYNDLSAIDAGCNSLWGTFMAYLGHDWLNPDPVITIEGRTFPLNLIGIRTATGVGDVNNDGIDDFAIGAANTNFDGRRGRVVVISGDTTLHVGIDTPRPELPANLSVSVYPNPFNSSTTISLEVPHVVSEVSISIYNVTGQLVHEAVVPAFGGRVEYPFDGNSSGIPLSTGLHFVRFEAGIHQATTKMVVLR